MLEMDETETCLTQLERIKELRSMGLGDVVRPSEIRLAQFDAAASGDSLSDSIATLEAQIDANANSGKALVTCQCGAFEMELLVPECKSRVECW